MSHTPLLGLVIPTWNAADELEATLNALRALPQDLLAPLDIVVADGGSTDRTLEVLASNADLVAHVDSQTDRGVYDAMNRGVTRTRAPWIWFMGAGDLPNAEGLQHAMTQLSSLSPYQALAFCVEALPPVEPGVPHLFSPAWDGSLLWKNTVHHQGLVAPKSWLVANPMPMDCRVLGDYAWLLDRWREGVVVACSPNVVLAKVQPGGLSRAFTASLYMEEWSVKRTRTPWWVLACHTVWRPLKWAFKQMSKAVAI